MTLDLAKLRSLAASHLHEQHHGNDTIEMADGVLALLDEIERLRQTNRALLSPEAASETERLLLRDRAALAAARDEACGIALDRLDDEPRLDKVRARIAELRKVGSI